MKKLIIMLADKFYALHMEDISFFHTSQEKVTAYTSDGKQHPVDLTLDMLTDQVDNHLFFRANRQFIISRMAIKDVDLWSGNRLSVNLLLPVPERIVISKAKVSPFKQWFMRE